MEFRTSKFRVALAVMLTACLFLLIQGVYIFRYPEKRISFTFFEPTNLPLGAKVKSVEVGAWYTRSNPVIPQDVIVIMDLDQPQSYIGLYPMDEDFKLQCEEENRSECSVETTPGGQQYTHRAVIDQFGKPWYEEVWFIKSDTRVKIYMEREADDRISGDEWVKTIDSFRPAALKDFTVRRYVPGP